jgi:hypothetical protein
VPSRNSAHAAAALLIALLTAAVAAQETPPAPPAFSKAEIAAAVTEVKKDPNLGSQRTIKMLRWNQANRRANTNPGWWRWIAGFFSWMSQSARYLMWAGIIFLAAWLGVYLTRAFRHRDQASAADAFVPPTHVRNLDIRPESLPPNIGAAARALWDRGEHRAALSLLYRGLLSRLTHVHRVPIKDSSTEGDCLSLLDGRVPPKTSEYSSDLVHAWQGFVYGGTATASPIIHALCDGFSQALDRAMPRSIKEQAE